MNNIKIYLFTLMLMVFSVSAFADVQEISDGIDCNRPTSSSELNRCMEEAIQNTPYIGPLLGMLKTPISVAMVNYFGNALTVWGDDSSFTLTYSASEKDYMTVKKETFFWGVRCVFLFLFPAYTCLQIFKSQKNGHLGSSRKDIVYYTLTSVGVLILLGFGTIFDFVAGAVLTSIVLGLSFIVYFIANVYVYTQTDIGHVTTEANAFARTESTPIIATMIKQQATNILYGSLTYNKYNFNNRNEKNERIFEDNAFSTCMSQSAEPTRFYSTLMLDGETQKTQKCLKTIGYNTFNLGSVNYLGKEESTKKALIEMNNIAQSVALDSIKLMCGNALNVENRRFDWETQYDAYDQCIDRISTGEVGKGANGEIKFFDQNDGITQASIEAQIEQMRKMFIDASTQYVKNHINDKVTIDKAPLADLFSFAMSFVSARSTTAALEKCYEEEFKTLITSVYDPTILGTADMAGLSDNSSIDNEMAVSRALKVTKVFDIENTIDKIIYGSLEKQTRQYMTNTLEYTANILFGDLYKTAGMTFEDCTKTINTCIAPVLNQSAAEFSNGIKILEKYWSMFIVTKSFSLVLNETESQKLKSAGRGFDFLSNVIGMAIAFLTTILVLSGLATPLIFIGRYAKSIFSLPSTMVKMAVRLLSLITPSKENRDKEKSFHVFLDFGLSLVWTMFELLIILYMMIVAFSLQGVFSVMIAFMTYSIVMPLVDNSSLISMAVGLIFMLLIHSSLSCYVKFQTASSLAKAIDHIQSYFKADFVEDATGVAISKYQEISGKLEQLSSKLTR